MEETGTVSIYIDGSCPAGNPGRGGWAAILAWPEYRQSVTGGVASTTNNQMEFVAALEGLRALTRPCRVHIYTDSQLLVGYMSMGWRSSNAALSMLREQIRRAIRDGGHHVSWHKVAAHAGLRYNEEADRLARAAAWRA